MTPGASLSHLGPNVSNDKYSTNPAIRKRLGTPAQTRTDAGGVDVRESYRLRVLGQIEELVRSLHPELERKVRAGLDLIRTDPEVGKELRDELAGLRSLRVGRLRIVYRVAARRLIDLVAIGPRRTIYQETLRLLQRG
jgi:mRNA-degrading endonuclease RelE of RelBE toxin-antitoxin system